MSGDRGLSRSGEMLLALVRQALGNGNPDEALLEGASPAQWQQTRHLACVQGVSALAFHSVSSLAERMRPPRELYLGWAANAHRITERYRRQQDAAARLAQILQEHSLRTMILKGLGTAQYYPIPHLRECGDIDLWLFGQHASDDRIARELGLEIDRHNPKHSQFVFQGILIENHRTFLDRTLYPMDRRLDRKLDALLRRYPCRPYELPGGGRIWFPPADFDALLLARHTAAHYPEGIRLRHLADWACFLSVEGRRLQATSFRRTLRKEGLERFVGALSAAACLYLGLSRNKVPFDLDRHRKDAGEMIAEILNAEPAPLPEGNRIAALIFKTRRFFSRQKRYRMVYGRFSLPRRVLLSLRSHLRPPETFFSDRIKSERTPS